MNMKEKLKEQDLRAMADCGICGEPFGKNGAPIFYRVAIATYAVNLPAVQRQDGLAAMLGGHSLLAAHMGPNNDMAQRFSEPAELTVCADCLVAETSVAAMMAYAEDQDEPALETTNE